VLIVAVLTLVFALSLVFRITNPKPTALNKTQVPANPTQDYSKINSLKPGKSSLQNVKEINGEPDSETVDGESTKLYYKTPLNGFTNEVVLKKNKLNYAVENIFGSYRGNVSEYITKFGEPDLILYDKETLYPWYIYLNKGLAIENDKTDILSVLYFVPSSEDVFMSTVAEELGMLVSPPDVE
jgi:hypothetical protein